MGKRAVVIGANSAIGKETILKLMDEDWAITAISRNSIEGLPASVQSIIVDINRDPFPTDSIEGSVSAVLYCPGSIELKPFRSLKPEQFRIDYEINVIGAVKSLQGLQRHLKQAEGDKSVVLFSTVAAKLGMPFHTSIAAAKGAIEGFVKSLAAEWAPSIRVNAIAPSLTDTPLASRLLASDQKREAGAARHPLNRIGQPEDLAELACFLLSERSSWITGQIIGVDGGLSTLKTA